MHLPGAERDVDERKPREHLLLDRLRPATTDAYDHLRPLRFHSLGLAEVCNEAVVGVLPDRARVEQDQIRLIATRRLAVAERFEHPLHSLGVVLVHLASERGDVVALHRASRLARDYLHHSHATL